MDKSIPTFSEILCDPKECKLPKTVDQLYEVADILFHNVSSVEMVDKVMEYILRLSIEFQVHIILGLIKLHPVIKGAKKIDAWITEKIRSIGID